MFSLSIRMIGLSRLRRLCCCWRCLTHLTILVLSGSRLLFPYAPLDRTGTSVARCLRWSSACDLSFHLPPASSSRPRSPARFSLGLAARWSVILILATLSFRLGLLFGDFFPVVLVSSTIDFYFGSGIWLGRWSWRRDSRFSPQYDWFIICSARLC